jgi:hypothetical protein
MAFRRPDMAMGAAAVPGEYERKAADPEILRSMLAELA